MGKPNNSQLVVLQLYRAMVESGEAPPLSDDLRQTYLEVPRCEFLPDFTKEIETADPNAIIVMHNFLIVDSGEHHTVPQSEPTFVLSMLSYLGLKKTHQSILEIGSGSGWVIAMLSHHCKRAYGTDVFEELCTECRTNLDRFGCRNAEIHHVKFGQVGLPEKARFERIIASCGMNWQNIPIITKQLSANGIAIVPIRLCSTPLQVLRKHGLKPSTEDFVTDTSCLLVKITKSPSKKPTIEIIEKCYFVPFL